MAAPLRVGVIGYGYWGPNLVRNFANDSRTKIVAIADPNPSRRQLAQAQYPYLKIHEDAGALIADPEVDAIAFATPIFTHHKLAKQALEGGKHVLVEKPLAASTEHVEELSML